MADRTIDVPLVEAWLQGCRLRGSDTTVAHVRSVRVNPYGSRSSSFVVELVTSTGRQVTAVLKGGPSTERTPAGDPWGPAYEASVYECILDAAPSYRSPFLDRIEEGDFTWILLQWVDGSMPVSEAPHPAGIRSAARWTGQFHRELVGSVTPAPPSMLVRYGTDLAERWIRSAHATIAEALPVWTPLADELVMAAPLIGLLLQSERTVVHGDLYPANVLVADGLVCPVDWEWAGCGAGELDLAALIDGWSLETVDACLRDYSLARWPAGTDGGFLRRLAAARLFLAARWMGEHCCLADDDRMVHHQLRTMERCLAELRDATPPGT